ncbi:MAG: hypothetical protein ACI9A2_004411, partial [Halioglobus sp.]
MWFLTKRRGYFWRNYFRRECLGSFAFSLGKKVGGVPKIVRELQVDFSTDQVIPAFRA